MHNASSDLQSQSALHEDYCGAISQLYKHTTRPYDSDKMLVPVTTDLHSQLLHSRLHSTVVLCSIHKAALRCASSGMKRIISSNSERSTE
eukprot:4690-Heterococcus_DN1.PRE.3